MGDRTSTDTRSPLLRPGFLIAAAVAIVLVLLLVFVLTNNSGSPSGPAIGQPAATAPSSTTSPGSSSTTANAAPTTIPQAAPDDVTWTLFQTVALPVSSTAGPRTVGTSTATGYAHTPTGALLAAVQIPARKLVAPDWRSVVDQQVVAGPGRDAYIKARQGVGDTTPTPGELGQITAFKFVNYSGSTATVQLVSRFISGKLQVVTLTMQWDGGDWKELLQPDGSDTPSVQALSDLAGYVQWGGV